MQLDTSSLADGEYIPFYSEIFTLKKENKKYYLGVNNGIYTSKDCSQAIKAFEISDNKLLDSLNLFKTADGLQNDILINFDFFSVVDRPERPLKLIRYDSVKKLLYIPEISNKDQVQKKYSVFKFTGQYFERIGSKRRLKIKSN